MTGGRSGRSPVTSLLAGAALLMVLTVGTLAVANPAGPAERGGAVAAAGTPPAGTPPADTPPAGPTTVTIPRIGVSSPLVPLTVDEAGVLEPPVTADVAGWHAAGTVPGEIGPAVLAGHVDSRSGPGVFVDLPRLVPGDAIEIVRADGTVLSFAVESTETVDKTAFPTERVYGPTPLAELRLITCGGWFDSADGHYVANVIVRATLQSDTGDDAGWTFDS